MKLDIASLAPDLERRADGIWHGPTQAPVSYPASGNEACLQVEDRSCWFAHRNRCMVSLVRRFAPSDVLLDIGGGNGFVAHGLAQAGIECALLEPGLRGAQAARARGVDPVICARLEDVRWTPGSVASAGMFDVLEHIHDDEAALAHVAALLRPGGHLFVTVPAFGFLHSIDDVSAGQVRRYTTGSLGRVLRGAGCRLVYAGYMFMPLLPPLFVLRTLPSRLGLRKAVDEQQMAAEHEPTGLAALVMERLLELEAQHIEGLGVVPCGTSCVAVAVRD
jgi:SAM-dependent methyltransferase